MLPNFLIEKPYITLVLRIVVGLLAVGLVATGALQLAVKVVIVVGVVTLVFQALLTIASLFMKKHTDTIVTISMKTTGGPMRPLTFLLECVAMIAAIVFVLESNVSIVLQGIAIVATVLFLTIETMWLRLWIVARLYKGDD